MGLTSVRDISAVTDPTYYTHERYIDHGSRGAAVRAFYTVRPLIPRPLQIAMRRVYARRQAKAGFPRFPAEPVLVDLMHDDLRRRIQADGGERAELVNFWPDGHRFASVVTHDVESAAGVANVEALREIERRHGIVSTWNFCAEEYPIPDGVFDALRAEGCEIGLHGLDHRCKLFSSRQRFERDLPRIHEYMREWDVVGFRSPALHRNADWMPELDCAYDSSFPDIDPFGPQPGGCCSIFPYFIGDLVELPVTMVQDHTLLEILRHDTIDLWRDKADWIAERNGLVNVIVHPDYQDSPERLAMYDELLAHLRSLEGGWHALSRDVAAWWRAREAQGADAPGATTAYAREVDGRVVIEP